MSCERYREAITDHAFGAPLDRTAASHLAACATCRRVFDDQKRAAREMDDDLREALAIAASPEFAARVSGRIRDQRPALPFVVRSWMSVAAAAVVVTALYLALGPRPGVPAESASANPPQAVALPGVERPSPDVPDERAAADPIKPAQRRAAHAPRTASAAATRMELEVIVPPDQSRAIARLKELVREGALDELPLPPAATAEDLFIAPLQIPDLLVRDLPGGSSADDNQR